METLPAYGRDGRLGGEGGLEQLPQQSADWPAAAPNELGRAAGCVGGRQIAMGCAPHGLPSDQHRRSAVLQAATCSISLMLCTYCAPVHHVLWLLVAPMHAAAEETLACCCFRVPHAALSVHAACTTLQTQDDVHNPTPRGVACVQSVKRADRPQLLQRGAGRSVWPVP
jgi:hypothetical protein